MMQLKLFRVFNSAQTLKALEKEFPEILHINNSIIGIPYDYGKNSYKSLLEKVKNLHVKQYIITPEKFFKLLNCGLENNYFISVINFLESVPIEHKEVINNYRNKINTESNIVEKRIHAENLFTELDWIVTDESIDIKKIGIRIQAEAPPIQVEFELYNNGVILIDNDVIKSKVIALLKCIE